MSDTDDRPNVVLVTTDQHRASAAGYADDEPVLTPNLDRLAGEGTSFDRAYANCPLCAPSRASIQTGRYPSEAGVRDNGDRLDDNAATLGEVFSAAGYRTGFVGKWHLSGGPENYGTGGGDFSEHVRSRGYDRAVVPEAAHAYFDVDHLVDGERVETSGYAPTVQTDHALEFLRESGDAPACLVVSYGPPHNPYEQVPAEFRERYDPEEVPLRPNVEPILPYASDHPEPVPLWAPPASVGVDRVDLDVSEKTYIDPREGLADYYAQISAVDHEIGRLLDGLDKFGMTDDTLVVYTADHGDQLWSQGHTQKGVPYEESIHVPLLARWPGEVPAGRRTEVMASLVDLAPTLWGLADIDSPDETAGEDLSPLVSGETDEGRDVVPLLSDAADWHGVRTDRYTYARTTSEALSHLPNGGWLLFDNADDPYQLRNRLYDPAYRTTRTDCERRVETFLERTRDSFDVEPTEGV